jgi:hypothetical protein
VELEQNLAALQKQGLGVAAISYDTPAVLKSFADRQHIRFTLLSDPASKIIRSYDILNDTVPASNMTYGIPYPGTFIVDTQGKVIAKYFEDDYRERVSASDILVRQYGAAGDAAGVVVDAKHLRLTPSASTVVARPGHRIVLSLAIDLPPGMHVYAPGVQGYIPIDWKLEDATLSKLPAFDYPASEQLRLAAINETVPVYRGKVRIQREITLAQQNKLTPLVSAAGDLVIKGTFRYQACDEKICHIPETVPVEWRFHFEGLDRQRAPAELQRKAP